MKQKGRKIYSRRENLCRHITRHKRGPYTYAMLYLGLSLNNRNNKFCEKEILPDRGVKVRRRKRILSKVQEGLFIIRPGWEGDVLAKPIGSFVLTTPGKPTSETELISTS